MSSITENENKSGHQVTAPLIRAFMGGEKALVSFVLD